MDEPHKEIGIRRFHIARIKTLVFGLLALSFVLLTGCKDKVHIPANSLVINEIMPANRTGIMTEDGRTLDWIEIKNISETDISLKGFSLMNKWEFPDTVIQSGKCIVVFLTKNETTRLRDDEAIKLYANVKLKKGKGCVQLVDPNDSVMSEVEFGEVNPDECIRRLDDGSYEKSYLQSPGFDNNNDGYESFCQMIESQRATPLKIWEVVSRVDRKKNWVELKNVSSDSVDLSKYSITSKAKDKGETWSLPQIILQPGDLCVVSMSGQQDYKTTRLRDNKTARHRHKGKINSKSKIQNSKLSASIKMSNSETIMLLKDGKFVDGVCAKSTIKGTSIGRVDGKEGFFYFATPSKGQENNSVARRYIAPHPKADRKSGFYGKVSKLLLHFDAEGRTIHYTLDGSEPDGNSATYKDSIVITKNTVLRAFCEGDSVSVRSGVMTATYILDTPHDIPVIFVAVKPSDMYDYHTGIYADGPGYTKAWPHTGANYYHDWEKAANVELLETTSLRDNEPTRSGFQTDCGLKIFGGLSRYEDKKSFCLKFKSEYGNSQMEYDFFGQGKKMELKDLVLRAGGQDWNRCMIRDEFFTSLMAEQSPSLLVQAYRPVALYINAEYFGLYYMREKVDKHYVARHLNVSSDSVSIITSGKYKEEGTMTDYQNLMKYLSSHDMSKKECYEYAKERIDLEGLIDYKLGEIYSANTDIGNNRIVRSADPKGDRKWHFVFYDLDATWVADKPAAKYLRVGGSDPVMGNITVQNKMIDCLLKNSEFRALMRKRIDHHFAHTFTPENTTKVFDELVAKVKPEMKRNCERWPQIPYNKWEIYIQKFRERFNTRNKVVLKDLQSELK